MMKNSSIVHPPSSIFHLRLFGVLTNFPTRDQPTLSPSSAHPFCSRPLETFEYTEENDDEDLFDCCCLSRAALALCCPRRTGLRLCDSLNHERRDVQDD